ncbi:hypothetical protein CsatA_027340 [Cannabis sativa]
MALPWFFFGKSFFSVIFLTISLSILSCVITIVVASWRIALILWCHHSVETARRSTQSALVDRGFDRKMLRSLPKIAYNAEVYGKKLTECAICLMEFVDGDVMRVLTHCGHGFHMNCIDKWLESHSSCPSCRDVLVLEDCLNCNGVLRNHLNGNEHGDYSVHSGYDPIWIPSYE